MCRLQGPASCRRTQLPVNASVSVQPGFLLAAEQKGFQLLEVRGRDPRLASLDTLSGEEIPLHFLFRLHGYIIHVGPGAAGSGSDRCRTAAVPVLVCRWCCCMSAAGATCGTAPCASRLPPTRPLPPSGCWTTGAMPGSTIGQRLLVGVMLLCHHLDVTSRLCRPLQAGAAADSRGWAGRSRPAQHFPLPGAAAGGPVPGVPLP